MRPEEFLGKIEQVFSKVEKAIEILKDVKLQGDEDPDLEKKIDKWLSTLQNAVKRKTKMEEGKAKADSIKEFKALQELSRDVQGLEKAKDKEKVQNFIRVIEELEKELEGLFEDEEKELGK